MTIIYEVLKRDGSTEKFYVKWPDFQEFEQMIEELNWCVIGTEVEDD